MPPRVRLSAPRTHHGLPGETFRSVIIDGIDTGARVIGNATNPAAPHRTTSYSLVQGATVETFTRLAEVRAHLEAVNP